MQHPEIVIFFYESWYSNYVLTKDKMMKVSVTLGYMLKSSLSNGLDRLEILSTRGRAEAYF
jgi:hypothetical protein